MRSLIVTRLASLPLVVLVLSILVFALASLIPGDVASATAGPDVKGEQLERLRHELGLDVSLPQQYVKWLSGAVQGDLGRSLVDGTPVSEMIKQRLPVTLSLTLCGALIACLIGLPAGLAAGLRPSSLRDRTITAGAALAVAIPSFWLGLLLVAAFSLRLPLFPATGYVPLTVDPAGWLRSMVLPAIALSATAAAALARQTRNSLTDVLSSDYIRTARAQGLSRSEIVRHHAIRNAAGPVITQLGFWVAILLGASLVVEQVFALPGMGTALAAAVIQQNLPVLVGLTMALVVLVVLVNLAVDMCVMYLNPKVRAS